MANNEDYIFDTIPYIPDIDLEELASIQNKLQSGYALDTYEATVFLDWITYNAREYAVSNPKDHKEKEEDRRNKITFNSMTGQCAPTQRVNVDLLRKFGLDARPFNTADCMGQIPKNEETTRRENNILSSPKVRHSVSMVSIPIEYEKGKVASFKYLLDPTFRQFCLKDNCIEKEEWSQHGYGAPHTGYFMKKENLRNLGVNEEEALKTENIANLLISRGYMLLDEESTRLYMNAFRRASIDKGNQYMPHEISGEQFVYNFENIPMPMLGYSEGNESEFTSLPSERLYKEQLKNRTVFEKIKDFFKRVFNTNKIEALPPADTRNFDITTKNPYEEFRKQYEIDGIVQGIQKGEVQQLDNLVKNNIDLENER